MAIVRTNSTITFTVSGNKSVGSTFKNHSYDHTKRKMYITVIVK